MTLRILLISIGLFAYNIVAAQNVEQFIAWAEKATTIEDHYGASVYYGEALKLDPGTMQLQWRYAEAARLSGQCAIAAENYGRVASKDHKRTMPLARMREAEMLTCTGRMKDAKHAWEQALDKERNEFGTDALHAKNALKGIAITDSLKAIPTDVELQQLPEPVNSCNADIAPRIGPDSSLYITTSRVQYDNEYVVTDTTNNTLNIVVLRHTTDGWLDLEKLPAAINNSARNGNATWTKEGHFIFSRCPIGQPCQILIADPKDPDLKVTELKGVNKRDSNTQPMVAMFKGEQTLFFTSDRRGSGLMDIWMGTLKDNEVTNIRTVGAPVNSPGNETCPFFDEQEQKLYFSSDFHPGMGGYDMFSSYPLQEGFSAPENWGHPFNTHKNELYPAFYKAMNMGFFSRSHSGMGECCAGQCCPDIFQFSYPKEVEEVVEEDTMSIALVEGNSTEIQSNLQGLLPIRLYFHNDQPNPRSVVTTTRFDYEQTYSKYRKLIPDYIEQQGRDQDRINAVRSFFDEEAEGNFNKLNRYMDLLQIVLQRGDTIELTIRGFASPLAKSDYNVNLSLRRISSLINYLNKYNGGALKAYIDGTAAKGQLLIKKAPYGETTAATGVSDNVSDQQNSIYSRGAAMERRIEIEAIDLFSSTTTTDTLLIIEDMGQVKEGMPKEVTVLIKNTNDRPLEFIDSKAACGCTNATLPDGAILPGESAPLKVHFNGRAPQGPFTRDIRITTNGNPKYIKLRLQGEIVK